LLGFIDDVRLAGHASMRPRLLHRGDGGDYKRGVGSATIASMRPRLLHRGDAAALGRPKQTLHYASMRPRLLHRGDGRVLPEPDLAAQHRASMRPRLLHRGDAEKAGHTAALQQEASMRPRLLHRGDVCVFRQGISRPYLTVFERSVTRSSWFRIDTRACTSIVDESRIFTMPNSASSASRCGVTTRALASARRTHYTITGLRSTTEKDFPRLSTRRRRSPAGPSSRMMTWSSTWSIVSSSASLSSIRRRRLSLHWNTDNCTHSPYPSMIRKTRRHRRGDDMSYATM
jgi:hypothetical protein